MLTTFLITFRETLEASLIIGIIFAFLKNSKEEKLFKNAYAGIIVGIIFSIIGAYLFNTFAGGFEGTSEQVFEGVIMLTGALLITTVIVFMQNHAKHLKKSLSDKIERNEGIGIFLLALVSILREGIETVIFLAAVSYADGISIIEGILGICFAIFLGYLIFKASIKIELKKFFQLTSVLLILFAAGLVAYGVHELEEAKVLNPIIEHVWDINPPAPLAEQGIYPFMHEKGMLGLFLKGLFGYNGNPSLLEVISYISYIGVVIVLTKALKSSSNKKIRNA